jgi:cytosine/adenosine deaminase-related metal-dependent hydrolase
VFLVGATVKMVDTLIINGIILTIDNKRRIIYDGAIAIENGYIFDIGSTKDLKSKYNPSKIIDAENKVVMPGLIDTHGHAGHSLIKTVAENTRDDWIPIISRFYHEATTPDYWYIDGVLSTLERLKFGVTCGVSCIGSSARTDDSLYALKHIEGVEEIGIRDIVAVGPAGPPYPNSYVKWVNNLPIQTQASFERNLEVVEEILLKIRNRKDDRIDIVMAPPTLTLGSIKEFSELKEEILSMKRMIERWEMNLHTHAYAGQIKLVYNEFDLLGPNTSLAHCSGLDKEEIQILAETDTKVCHSPSARSIIPKRCPVVELLDAGVTVAISTDGSAPDRTFDLFKELRQAMSLQRHYFKDENVMPPGKVIEMVTIDAAKTLGYEDRLGSIEIGKQADIILIDMLKPHLVPFFMIPHRIAYEVSGQDVDTVLVNGVVKMENRQVLNVDERKILFKAQEEAQEAISRGGLEKYLKIPNNFWGNTRY